MQSMNAVVVRGKDGWCGTVLPPDPATHSDPTHVRVQLENGEHYLVPAAVVIPHHAPISAIASGIFSVCATAPIGRLGDRDSIDIERFLPD